MTVRRILFAVLFACAAVAAYDFFRPRDDTDPPDGHSGMTFYVDHRTQCQYLGNPRGGITPRVDAQGRHMCEALTK